MKLNEIIIQPVLTEKTTKLAAANYYAFKVSKLANKHDIKKALEQIFQVEVATIKIVNRKGKTRKVGRRMTIKQMPNTKIAYIKLKTGKIDLFPQA